MRTVPTLVLLTGLALGLSACGGGDADEPDAAASPTATSPAPTTTAPPTDVPTDPPTTGKPGAGTTTVTGTVSQGVEPGCVVLDAGGEQLLLVGAERGSTPDGARVTVTGTRTPGLVSTCQQGTPFEVTSVEPAA